MSDPFEPPKTEAKPEAEALHDPGPATDEEMPVVAAEEAVLLTTTNVLMEAEMIASRLRGSNIAVLLKDHAIVGAHAFIAPVVGGVKIMVREADLERAKALLEVPHRGGDVFVVHRRSPILYGALGGAAGALLGAGLFELTQAQPLFAVAVVGGVIEGVRRGVRGVTYCASCLALMSLGMKVCPKCEGVVAGIIDHPRKRLEAEERLRDSRGAASSEP